jgi:hypothetical protein
MAASASRAGASRAYGASGRSRLALAPGRRGAGGRGAGAARRRDDDGLVSTARTAASTSRSTGQLPALSVSVIWVLACLVASATEARSVKIETSMSGRMLAASTFAQLGEVGVKRLFLAVASNTDR